MGQPLFLDLATPLLIALAAIRMVVYAMRRLFADSAWLATSERAIGFSIWGLVILYFIGVLPEITRELDDVTLPAWQVVDLAAHDRQRHRPRSSSR